MYGCRFVYTHTERKINHILILPYSYNRKVLALDDYIILTRSSKEFYKLKCACKEEFKF